MNRLLVLLPLLLLTLCAHAQPEPPDTLWTHTYGGANVDEALGVCATTDGGYVAVGRSRSFSAQFDVYAVRVNSMGDTLWTRTYGGNATDEANDVSEIPGIGFAIAGTTQSFGAGLSDIYVICIAENGDTLWTRTFGTSGLDFGYAVTTTLDGGIAVAGTTTVPNQSINMSLMKLNSQGDILWSRTYGDTNVDEAFSINQTPDGGFLLSGRTVPTGASVPDMYAVRTNSAGDTLWTRRVGNDDWEEGAGAIETSDGGTIVAGWKQVPGNSTDFYVVKTAANGTVLWSHTFGGSGVDRATSIRQSTDGGSILGGYTTSMGAGSSDMYFIKLDTNGDTTWTRTAGGAGADYLYAIAITADGGYIAAGATNSFGLGGSDVWLVCLSGFSGVAGFVRDSVTGEALSNVWVGAIGQPFRARSDAVGYYVLTLPPDITYDIITFGACVGRDTVWSIPIFQDSITALDLLVEVPHGVVPQTSLNIVAHNHITETDTLRIYNEGLGVLDFTIAAETISPPTDWLTVEPASGSIPAGDSIHVAVNVLADTTDDGAFDFYGSLTVRMNSCPDSAVPVNVIASILDADDKPNLLPSSFTLSAYPNPFNPVTTLSFSLPHDDAVTLIIYDLLGREVRRLLDAPFASGMHRVTFDASDLPSGLYVARLHTSKANLSHKMLLMK